MLIEAGLDLNAPDALDRTPLERLVEAGDEEAVQSLVTLALKLTVTPGVEDALAALALAKPAAASQLQKMLGANKKKR